MKPFALISAAAILFLFAFSTPSAAHERDQSRGHVQLDIGSGVIFGGGAFFYPPWPGPGIPPYYVPPGFRIHIHYGDHPRPYYQRDHHRHHHRAHIHHRGYDRHYDRGDHDGYTKKRHRRFR